MSDDIEQIYLDTIPYKKRSHAELVELHERATAGDQEAFNVLWLHGAKLCVNIARRLNRLGLVSSAEFLDLVQEGNLAVRSALPKWDPDKGNFTTWIGFAARGYMLNWAREKARVGGVTGKIDGQLATVLTATEATEGQFWDAVEETFASTDSGPSLLPEDAVDADRVLRIAEQVLTPRELYYVNCIYRLGLKQAELARLEGRTQSSIASVVNNALDKLRVIFS